LGTDVSDAKTRLFLPLRKRLLGIAVRVLGVPADAEDVVQEAYLRLHRVPLESIACAEAWLVTVVTRLAIDRRRERIAFERALAALDAARLLSPQPVMASTRHVAELGPQVAVSEEGLAELRAEVGRALRALHGSVSAHEALALLLHEVFEADYRDLSRWLGKSEEACRQLLHRARKKLAKRPADDAGQATGAPEVQRWLQALRDRDHRSVVAELLRDRAQPPVVLAASAGPTVGLRFDADGRLAWRLGTHLLCRLPVGAGEQESEREQLAA
jgi:RNA polymerase sigma-70 factor (ECF subfamily)